MPDTLGMHWKKYQNESLKLETIFDIINIFS